MKHWCSLLGISSFLQLCQKNSTLLKLFTLINGTILPINGFSTLVFNLPQYVLMKLNTEPEVWLVCLFECRLFEDNTSQGALEVVHLQMSHLEDAKEERVEREDAD